MSELPDGVAEVLQLIINETRENCPPTAARLKDVASSPGYVRAAVQRLMALDYVIQPYPRGPYVPVKDVDGSRLMLLLLDSDDMNEMFEGLQQQVRGVNGQPRAALPPGGDSEWLPPEDPEPFDSPVFNEVAGVANAAVRLHQDGDDREAQVELVKNMTSLFFRAATRK